MAVSLKVAVEHAHQEPEFLKSIDRRGNSTLYITPMMIGKTRILFAFGKITVAYDNPSSNTKIDYEIGGTEVFIDGRKCNNTSIYIREPDYLYMEIPYRTLKEFEDQFNKGKYYRRWKTPACIESTRMVRHFEIYFGKSISDVYVTFDGEVYSEPKEDTKGNITEIDLGWKFKNLVSDDDLDPKYIQVKYCKEPILLTPEDPDEPASSDSNRVENRELERKQKPSVTYAPRSLLAATWGPLAASSLFAAPGILGGEPF